MISELTTTRKGQQMSRLEESSAPIRPATWRLTLVATAVVAGFVAGMIVAVQEARDVPVHDAGSMTLVNARCSFKYELAQAGGVIEYFYVDSHLSRTSHYCTHIRSLVPNDWKVTVTVIGKLNGNASVSRYFTILADGSVLTRAS